MPLPVILIFDIGKTNKKVFLFDEDYNIVFEKTEILPEIKDETATKRNFPAGMVIVSALLLGGAGLMRWKGMV